MPRDLDIQDPRASLLHRCRRPALGHFHSISRSLPKGLPRAALPDFLPQVIRKGHSHLGWFQQCRLNSHPASRSQWRPSHYHSLQAQPRLLLQARCKGRHRLQQLVSRRRHRRRNQRHRCRVRRHLRQHLPARNLQALFRSLAKGRR